MIRLFLAVTMSLGIRKETKRTGTSKQQEVLKVRKQEGIFRKGRLCDGTLPKDGCVFFQSGKESCKP